MGEIRELLKLAADSMKNRTLQELLKNDEEYQNRHKQEQEAYQEFIKLELTDEQRNVVENLIARKDEAMFDYNANIYIAGMLDAYEILRQFNLTKE